MRVVRTVNAHTFMPQAAVLDDTGKWLFAINLEALMDLTAAGNSTSAAFESLMVEHRVRHPAAVDYLWADLNSSSPDK